MKAFVISIDVNGSQKDNLKLQKLKKTISFINRKYEKVFIESFSILRSDEAQAIIHVNEYKSILKIVFEINSLMGFGSVCMGIAYDKIYLSNSDSKDSIFGSWKYDGQAFYKARQLVEENKQRKNSSIRAFTSFELFDKEYLNDSLNLLYYSADKILSKWDEKMRKIYNLLEEGYNHKEIAIELNKNDKNRTGITRKINSNQYYYIKDVESNVFDLIKGELL